MTTDHFDSYVEDAAYREASPDGAHSPEDDVPHDFTGGHPADPGETADTGKSKKKGIPTPLIIVGGMILFGVGMTVYKTISAPPRPSYAAISANGGASGMIVGTPRSAFPHPIPPLPVPQDGIASQAAINTAPDAGFGASSAAPSTQTIPGGFRPTASSALPVGTSGGLAGATPNAIAFASPAPASSAVPLRPSAALPNTVAANDAGNDPAVDVGTAATGGTKKQAAEIAVLKAQVKSLQEQLANAPSGMTDYSSAGLTSSAVPAHSAHKKSVHVQRKHDKHGAVGKDGKAMGAASSLSNLHIKQVIPGQGWVEDESSGKQQVVAVGDMIGTAKVTKIDADNYRIETTQGVIQ